MFLLRKFRCKSVAMSVLTLLAIVIVMMLVTASRSSSNHGNDRAAVSRKQQQMKHNMTAPSSASVGGTETLSPILYQRLKSIANSSSIIERQIQRQKLLAAACKRLGLGRQTPNFKTSDMYINDTLQYIYCVVNKVACTSWKRALLMASGEMNVDKPEKLSMTFVHNWHITDRYFRRIRTFSLEQVQQRLQTHFKFMFVRHPLERLVSTYRDKFTKTAYYYPMRFGRKIIRTIRGANASEKSLKRGHDVKFREMIQYLLDPQTTHRLDQLVSDNHWKPEHQLCHPCYVHYDFIGHHDTLGEDAQTVLHLLGVSDRVRFPDSDPDNHWKRKTKEVYTKILQEISADELRRVKKLYAHDFELFGYDKDVL